MGPAVRVLDVVKAKISVPHRLPIVLALRELPLQAGVIL